MIHNILLEVWLLIQSTKRGSVFISYRAASELPLARILFDELNHTMTPGGHRVTVFWDAHRLVKVLPFPYLFPFVILTLFVDVAG